MIILGYDPGGKGANGLAVLEIPAQGAPLAAVHTSDSVDDALQWFQGQAQNRQVDAAGIDTYLCWDTQAASWRPMDLTLRAEYPEVENSVFAINSARGAMCIQGLSMATRIRNSWPAIRLNETHPKVLYYALTNPHQPYDFSGHGLDMTAWLLQFTPPGIQCPGGIHNDHEWDALISAWATWQAIAGNWPRNLVADALQLRPNLIFPIHDVTYYWPPAQ